MKWIIVAITDLLSDANNSMVSMLLAAITGLSSVVALLYKQNSDNHKIIAAKLDDCEKDRENLWKILAQQNGQSVEQVKAQIQKEQK